MSENIEDRARAAAEKLGEVQRELTRVGKYLDSVVETVRNLDMRSPGLHDLAESLDRLPGRLRDASEALSATAVQATIVKLLELIRELADETDPPGT